MPKMKTKSSAKKRFKVTGSGKIKRKHAFKSHILTKKSKKRKLRLTHDGLVHKSDRSNILQQLTLKQKLGISLTMWLCQFKNSEYESPTIK